MPQQAGASVRLENGTLLECYQLAGCLRRQLAHRGYRYRTRDGPQLRLVQADPLAKECHDNALHTGANGEGRGKGGERAAIFEL